MKEFDIVVLTDGRYVNPKELTPYINNVLLEDQLVVDGLIKKGLKVTRTNWDNPSFDWNSTRFILFRTTWDYFDRFDEFFDWLSDVSSKTQLINSADLIHWNIDKHYLSDLANCDIPIPPTVFIDEGATETLQDLVLKTGWEEVVLKPAISGAGRHTYRFKNNETEKYAEIFDSLIEQESLLVQQYQKNITEKGEIALIFFGQNFSHAILKKAKKGEFRVQDDFGGTVHDYQPSDEEINFALTCLKACPEIPLYARVDLIWDNQGELCLSELELIEPELWFRKKDNAADLFASNLLDYLSE